jgi:hypothetical protein
LTGSDPEGPQLPVVKGSLRPAFKVVGDKVIQPDFYFDYDWCSLDSLKHEHARLSGDTMDVELSENRLILVQHPYPRPSGVVYREAWTFARTGSGTGLTGRWEEQEITYRIAHGVLGPADSLELDTLVRTAKRRFQIETYSAVFAGDSMVLERHVDQLQGFVGSWNGYVPRPDTDSARLDVELKILDSVTVELKGRKNGETVRIEVHEDRIAYTSDNPAHPSGTWYVDPKSCPQGVNWFYTTFREENKK